MRRWTAAAAALAMGVAFVVAATSLAEGISLNGYFNDDDGHLFESDINSIANTGITKGCNPPANTNFCPNDDVDRGAMAAFLKRALNLPAATDDYFIDDTNSIFEGDINSIAEAGITKGCNPPTNNRFCPNDVVDRGAMAAFLKRALNLPASGTDHFTDDNNSIFEADINAIADAGITKGCNPPTNNNYCPTRDVDRGAMAAFLKRALGLPSFLEKIPIGIHSQMSCSKDGESCSLTVDLSAGPGYLVEEGLFQYLPASASEIADFNDNGTAFSLLLDGQPISLSELPELTTGDVTERRWRKTMTFGTSTTHTLVGEWRWDGQTVQTNTITIRASG